MPRFVSSAMPKGWVLFVVFAIASSVSVVFAFMPSTGQANRFVTFPRTIDGGGGSSGGGLGYYSPSSSVLIPPVTGVDQNGNTPTPEALLFQDKATARRPATVMDRTKHYVEPSVALKPPREDTTVQQLLTESQSNVRSIMGNAPSLSDLYTATVKIRRAMEEKEHVYEQMISKLQTEREKSKNAVQAWQKHYNTTISSLQLKAVKAQQEVHEKDAQHKQQMQQLKSEMEIKQNTAIDKINWLTDQLQQLKIKTHEQQIEASKAAKAQQKALLDRIDELQQNLKAQIAAKEEEGTKAKSYLRERMEVQAELARIQGEFQQTVADLNQQLSQERKGREEDRREAEVHLAEERQHSQRKIATVQRESAEQKAAAEREMAAKVEEFNREVLQIRKIARVKEEQLNGNIEKMKQDLVQVKADSEKRLNAERETAAKIREGLEAKIVSKEQEIKEQLTLKNVQAAKFQDLMAKRMELEKDLSTLKKEKDDTITMWETRLKSLETQHAVQLKKAEEQLTHEREVARKELKAALDEAEEQKAELKKRLKIKDNQHSIEMRKLENKSVQKERELKSTIEATSNELQELRFTSHKKIMAEREMSRAKQEELLARISDRESELEKQILLTKEQTDKAGELWQRRMDLESEVASLRSKHSSMISSWEQRYQQLEKARRKEARAAEALLNRKHEEAQQEIDAALQKVEEQRMALQNGLMAKDKHYQQMIQRLEDGARAKEQELKASLQRIGNDLQQVKLDSHQKIMAEKEKSLAAANQLLNQISEKEKLLLEQIELTAYQTARADELQEKQAELEEELALANQRYKDAVSLWEGKYQSLEDERAQERKEAQKLLVQTEAEANARLDASINEAQEQKSALESTIKLKEAEHSKRMRLLKEEAQMKEKTIKDNLDRVATDFQQFKLDSHTRLMAEKEAYTKKEKDLSERIQRTELELKTQSELAATNGAKAEELWQTRMELERKLNDMKGEHTKVVADWKIRYATLEDASRREKQASAEALARSEAQSRVELEEANKRADHHKDELSRYLQHIASQETMLKVEMEQMASMLGSMQNTLEKITSISFDDFALPPPSP